MPKSQSGARMGKRMSDSDIREMLIILYESSAVYEQTLASIFDSVKTVLRDVARLDRTQAKTREAEEAVKKLNGIQARLSQHASYDGIIRRLKGD
jgi:hypothetical protein